MISGLGIVAQPMSDRALAGLRGNVKTVETSSQSIDMDGKASYPVEKQSTDEYDKSGNLVKTTSHVSRGHSLYLTIDGKRVSKWEQTGEPLIIQTLPGPGGIANDPAPPKQTGDARYEHKYTYKYDTSGRITEIEDHRNDGSLWQTRKFTYDAAGRLASEIVTEKGRPSHGDTYKYDASGTGIERGGIFYLASGEKEVTPFLYSRIKIDSQGNWIERTVSQGNGESAEVIAIETRKIKYH